MRKLIAVVTCDDFRFRERANAQRETWVPEIKNADVKFFLGRTSRNSDSDEIILDVDDGYKELPAKVQGVCRWALDNGYDYIFKTDDDVYINVPSFETLSPAPYDYVGRFRGPSDPHHPWDYASGFGYWLSRRAMQIVVDSPLDEAEWAEDRWVAKVLQQAGIQGYTDDGSYVVAYPPLLPETIVSGGIRNASIFCQFPPVMLKRLHSLFKNRPRKSENRAFPLRPIPLPNFKIQKAGPEMVFNPKPKADLSKVCVLIKTFLRDGYLFDCVAGLEKRFPEIKMVIADDGRPNARKSNLYGRLRAHGHTVLELPFDVGFGAKANAAIPYFDRPYVLIGSDDFNFDDDTLRASLEKLLIVLESLPDVAVASGRVDRMPYEGFLSYGPDFIRETPLVREGPWPEVDGVEYAYVDLTVNFSLIRKSVLGFGERQVAWVPDFKIGGEHFWFFYHLKRADWKVVFVPGVDIQTMRPDPNKMDADYPRFRGRAWDCVGKFVKMWCGKIPDHFYYIGFDGAAHDYVAIAKQRGLILPNGELKP
jgi:hypothetical protein